MKTEYEFGDALKKMMETTPLDEISVVALSKKCGVSRKTFYYHFRDVYDLLTLVFLNEKEVLESVKVESHKDLVEAIYNYYTKNALFIDATLASAGKDLFEEFVFNFCYKSVYGKFVTKSFESKRLSEARKKDIARFYSFAYSSVITYYLSTHKNKSLSGLKKCFSFIDDYTFSEAVNKLIKMEAMD